jgi:hypothetical protein
VCNDARHDTLVSDEAISMENSRRGWFGPKRLGIGYGPRTWEGWLISAVYLIMMLGLRYVVSPRSEHSLFISILVLLTVAYAGVFIWKFERDPPH